jgi:hypothetical protein
MVRQRSPGSLTQTLKHTDVACIDDRGGLKGPFLQQRLIKARSSMWRDSLFPFKDYNKSIHAKSSPTTSQRSSIESFSTRA